METNFILANGWGIIDGKWVYIPLWDPIPVSQTGKDLLTLIVIRQNIGYIKNNHALAAFWSIAKQRQAAVAKAFGSSSYDSTVDDYCGTKPKKWPPKGTINVRIKHELFLSKEIASDFNRLHAKANLLQLGKLLKNKDILSAVILF